MSYLSSILKYGQKLAQTAKNNPKTTTGLSALAGLAIASEAKSRGAQPPSYMQDSTPWFGASQEQNMTPVSANVSPSPEQTATMSAQSITPQAPQQQTTAPNPYAPQPSEQTESKESQYSPQQTGNLSGEQSYSPEPQQDDVYALRAKIRAQQMSDRIANRGVYELDPNMAMSPDQVRMVRNAGDRFYESQIAGLDSRIDRELARLKTPTGQLENLFGGGSSFGGATQGTDKATDMLLKAVASKAVDIKDVAPLLALPEEQRYTALKSALYNSKMTADERKNYDATQSTVARIQDVYSSLGDATNNPYKYMAQSALPYLGGEKDPRYTNLLAVVGGESAEVRNRLFGSALTDAEAKLANDFLPNLQTDSIGTIAIKLRVLQATAEFAQDAMIANRLGQPRPNYEKYARKAEANAYGFSDAEFEKRWNEMKGGTQSTPTEKPQSFNQVGNTTVSIPATSRLAYVNNNPGNLRYAGQKGAVQGEGNFARFKNPQEGYNALKNQIKLDASRGHTLASFISKYAPPTENDTSLYIRQAVTSLGATPNTPIKDVPLEQLAKFVALKESSTKINS